MQFSITPSMDALLIALTGTFRFDDSELFKGVLKAIDNFDGQGITIDLAGTTALDSAGVGMLLLAHERAKKQSKVVTLRGAQGSVQHVLDVTKIDMIMTVLP